VAAGYGESVGNIGGLLLGTLVCLLALAGGSAALFRVKHWRDWPDRWQSAHPAVAWVLAADLFIRFLFRDRAMPRSRREALLWEAPSLLLNLAVMVAGLILVAFGPADS
jgi:hypothetical protein